METYTFEADPGHAWLGVPITELLELEIAHKITSYSYWEASTELVWLEEDCDAGTFLHARGKLAGYVEESFSQWLSPWYTKHIRDNHSNNDSRIRNMPRFDLVAVQQERNAYVDPAWVKVTE